LWQRFSETSNQGLLTPLFQRGTLIPLGLGAGPLFLPFLGRGGGLHLAHGAGLPASAALLGFAAGFHFAAAFFTGKNGHESCLRNQKIIGRRPVLVRVASPASIPPHPALTPLEGGEGKAGKFKDCLASIF